MGISPVVSQDEKGNELEVTNKALLFSHKTELPEAFKEEVTKQLKLLFSDPRKIDKVTINEFANIGSTHMISSKEYQPKLNKRVMDIIGNRDDGVVEGLLSLKNAAYKVTGKKISLLKPTSIADKVLKMFGKDWNKGAIAKAVVRYETASELINSICTALAEAKNVIVSDLQTLLNVGDDLVSCQMALAKDIFFLENLIDAIESGEQKLPELTEESTLSLVVSLRQDLLDMKALETVNAQYLTTIEQTCKGARLRIKSVDRACGLTLKVAGIGLLLRGVMENNDRIQAACDASREFTSMQLVANAEMFKEQSERLQSSASKTFAAIEDLKKAHDIIQETINSSENGLSQSNEELKRALNQINQIRLPEKTASFATDGDENPISLPIQDTEKAAADSVAAKFLFGGKESKW